MARLKPLWLHLEPVAARMEQARRLVVACDFDGTLTPIVSHPDDAGLSPRARAALQAFAARDDALLALLSGRRLDDLSRRVGVDGAYLAGAAGLETRDREGRVQSHWRPEQASPPELREQLAAWCQRFPGAWIEDKGVAYALHYRGVEPALQPAFGAGVRRRVRPWAGRARLVHGKRVFEIMPALDWDKGRALTAGLDPFSDGTLVFYFGDDANDEPVHELVRSRGGISVAVGRPASKAEFVLPSPREVVWFLEWLGRQWSARDDAAAARTSDAAHAIHA